MAIDKSKRAIKKSERKSKVGKAIRRKKAAADQRRADAS